VKSLFIAFGVVLAGTVSVFLLLSQDVSFDDSDLLLEKIRVPETENAFSVFERATNEMESIESFDLSAEEHEKMVEILEGGEWDAELVESAVSKNSGALLYIDEFLQFSVLQFPELEDPENYTANLLLRSMGEWRVLARLKALQSLALLKRGREKEAFDQAMNIVRFGQTWEDAPRPFLIQYLVGSYIKGIGLETMRMMLPDSSLTSQDLLSLARELENYGANKESLKTTMKGEYMTIMNALSSDFLFGNLDLSSNTLFEDLLAKSPYHFKLNETKLLFAEGFRVYISNLDQEYYSQIEKSESPFLYFYPESAWQMFVAPNSIGKLVFYMIMVNTDLARLAAFEDVAVQGTRTMFALRAYYQDNGSLPETLDALAPNYLNSPPRDPFDGNVLRFSPQEGLVYSIGQDLQETAEDKSLEDGTAFQFEIR